MKITDFLRAGSEALDLPEDYYHGLCLPEKFALPDNILMFFARWGESNVHKHCRYSLVIPFSPVIYCVEQSRYELDSGMGLLLFPWQKHSHLAGSENMLCERLLITFELPHPQNYLPDTMVMKMSEKAGRYVMEMFECYRLRQLPELSWLLVKLLKELSGKTIAAQEYKLSELTTNCIRLIGKDIRNAADIQCIADELHISASHLRMVFRKDMGMSIGKYIAEQRMRLACVQLQDTGLPVQEIAENCGFASICAFSHFFKNKLGISPREFRERK